MPHDPDYREQQAKHDQAYERAWEYAPKNFLKKAKQLGLTAELEQRDGMAMAYDENMSRVQTPGHSPSFSTPDMALLLDDYIDEVIERHGTQHAGFIRALFEDFKKPMNAEIERNNSVLLNRMAGGLIADINGKGSSNLLARVHALLHSIPRLASINGYPSLRESAKSCKVSAEWMRRTRDKWCDILGIPIPSVGQKSDAAKAKYKKNALNNHWRHQKFKAPTAQPIV